MITVRLKYKVHAKAGIPETPLVQLLTILDTEPGPNFIRKDVMAAEMLQITEHGAFHNICDDIENLIRMAGHANFQVELGPYRLWYTENPQT